MDCVLVPVLVKLEYTYHWSACHARVSAAGRASHRQQCPGREGPLWLVPIPLASRGSQPATLPLRGKKRVFLIKTLPCMLIKLRVSVDTFSFPKLNNDLVRFPACCLLNEKYNYFFSTLLEMQEFYSVIVKPKAI